MSQHTTFVMDFSNMVESHLLECYYMCYCLKTSSLPLNFRRGSSQYQDFRGWHMTISFRWRGIYFTMISQRSSYCRVSLYCTDVAIVPVAHWLACQAATRAKKHASCFLASINIDEPLYWQIIGIGHSWLWSPHKKYQEIMEPSMWRDHHLAQGAARCWIDIFLCASFRSKTVWNWRIRLLDYFESWACDSFIWYSNDTC